MLGLRGEELVLGFEELAVVALGAKHTGGIGLVELGHLRGDVLEKIAVVADDNGGEGFARQQCFEPLDAFEVEVVGGLVEQ